jgi:DNA invertase Pin-like site-specific DNA recombinase
LTFGEAGLGVVLPERLDDTNPMSPAELLSLLVGLVSRPECESGEPLDSVIVGHGTIREFIRRGVIVRTVINNMTFDGSTKDPMQQAVRDALIAFMAATAEAQAEATKEAQRAGILYARANDDGTKFRGRKPTFNWETFTAVQQLLGQGVGVAEVAKITGLKRQTVYRIQREPGRQAAALAAWSTKSNERIAA